MRLNSYKIIDHPSDIGISVYAETIEALFEICAEAMFAIICDIAAVKRKEVKKIKIHEKMLLNPDDLLISWLERLLYIHETEKMLFSGFKIKKIQTAALCIDLSTYNKNISGSKSDTGNAEKNKISVNSKKGNSVIIAEAFGQIIDFGVHEIFVSIKAPTYHMLNVECDIKTGYWKAAVIFDV